MLCGQVDHCTNQSVNNTSEKVSNNLVFVFFLSLHKYAIHKYINNYIILLLP